MSEVSVLGAEFYDLAAAGPNTAEAASCMPLEVMFEPPLGPFPPAAGDPVLLGPPPLVPDLRDVALFMLPPALTYVILLNLVPFFSRHPVHFFID